MKQLILLPLLFVSIFASAAARLDAGKPYYCMPGQIYCDDGGCMPKAAGCRPQAAPHRINCGISKTDKGTVINTCGEDSLCDDRGTCFDHLDPRVCQDLKHCPVGSFCDATNKCITLAEKSMCLINASAFKEAMTQKDFYISIKNLDKISTYYTSAKELCVQEKNHEDIIAYIDDQYRAARTELDAKIGVSNNQTLANVIPQECKPKSFKGLEWCSVENFPGGNQKNCIGVAVRTSNDSWSFLPNPNCAQKKYYAAVTEFDQTPDCRQNVIEVDPNNLTGDLVNSTTLPSRVPAPFVIEAILAEDGKHTPQQIRDCFEKRHQEELDVYRPCKCSNP